MRANREADQGSIGAAKRRAQDRARPLEDASRCSSPVKTDFWNPTPDPARRRDEDRAATPRRRGRCDQGGPAVRWQSRVERRGSTSHPRRHRRCLVPWNLLRPAASVLSLLSPSERWRSGSSLARSRPRASSLARRGRSARPAAPPGWRARTWSAAPRRRRSAHQLDQSQRHRPIMPGFRRSSRSAAVNRISGTHTLGATPLRAAGDGTAVLSLQPFEVRVFELY